MPNFFLQASENQDKLFHRQISVLGIRVRMTYTKKLKVTLESFISDEGSRNQL